MNIPSLPLPLPKVLLPLFCLLCIQSDFFTLSAIAESVSRPSLENRVERLERERLTLERSNDQKTRELDRRLEELEDDVAAAGVGLLGSGILCALWAQFTERSAWLWFFFGVFLCPVALIVMAWKNAEGLKSGEIKYWTAK